MSQMMFSIRKITRVSRNPIQRCLFYNQAGKSYSYRDVVVVDHCFDLLPWLNDQQKTITSLKHPSSGHALSGYANSDYHRPYNYNNIGEFSLNLAAGQYLSAKSSPANTTTSSTPEKRHDIIIWPDGLYVSNLISKDIPVLYGLISNEKPLDVASVQAKVNTAATVCSLHQSATDLTILINVSKSYPVIRMQQVMQWFQDSFKTWSVTDQAKTRVDFIVSTELSEHRNATQIMVLPYEDCFEGILTYSQVNKIVNKYQQLLQSS